MFIKSVVGSSQLVSPSRSSFSMEEATSFEELHEAQTKKNQLLRVSEIKFQEQIAGIDRKFEHFTHTLAPTSRFGNESVFGVFSQTPGDELSGSQNYVHTPLPRMDFSRFDGSNPRNWILQCNNYFKPMPSMSDAQRIDLAIRHFDGRAFSWIQDLNMGEIEITWKQFLEVVCARFEKLTVSNMMVELNELKQIGSYENYVERFEELRAYILLNDNYRYSDASFVASFLSGLSEELQEFINLFQPTNLEQAIELGRNRIHTLDAFSKGMSPDSSSFQIQFPTFVGMIEEDHIIDAQKAKKMLPPDAEFGDVVVVEDDAGFMLTTWGDLNLISRKFSTLDPCGQASAAREGIVMAYVKKKGKVIEVGGREMSVLTSKSQATYEKNGDHVMTFAVFLNGKKVKLKSPTAAVESIFTTEHVLSSFTRKEKKDIEHIFVLGSDAKPDTSTLRLDFTLEEYSDAFDANGKKEERHFEMGVYKMNIPASYTILPTFHASLFQRCISTEIIPVGESLEDDVVEYNEPAFLSVPGKHYKIQSFSHGIQSELEFVVEVAAAYIFVLIEQVRKFLTFLCRVWKPGCKVWHLILE